MEWIYIICILLDQGKNVLSSIKHINHQPFVNKMVSWLSQNSNIVDQIITAFENRNFSALTTLISQNPVLAKGSAAIKKSTELMNELKMKKAEIEGKLNAKLTEYQNKNDNTNIVTHIYDKITGADDKLEGEISELKNQYNSIVTDIKNTAARSKSGTRRNAISGQETQNVKGGML